MPTFNHLDVMIEAMRKANRKEELRVECRAETDKALRQRRAETKQCFDDSCDGGHCAKCGCHFLVWGERGICDGCKMTMDQIAEQYTSWINSL